MGRHKSLPGGLRWAASTGILLLSLPLLLGGRSDPGVLIELDRQAFSLVVHDLAGGAEGPRLRVVLGSPAHPTPRGAFSLHQVVRHPGWIPGRVARALGAKPEPPSDGGPLGVGKIPFAHGGEIALHGGADPLLLGKPVSLGCVRATDADLLALIAWLEERGALYPPEREANGELHQRFRRPARVEVH